MTHTPTAAKKQEGQNERPKHPDIDGGWGWWVVFASFMIHIVSKSITHIFYSLSTWIIQVFTSNLINHIFFTNSDVFACAYHKIEK